MALFFEKDYQDHSFRFQRLRLLFYRPRKLTGTLNPGTRTVGRDLTDLFPVLRDSPTLQSLFKSHSRILFLNVSLDGPTTTKEGGSPVEESGVRSTPPRRFREPLEL